MYKKKLVVFGGSFNPVHNGHVKLALGAREAIGADKLLVVPTNMPPHKNKYDVDAFHRLDMCRTAFGGFDGVEVSDLEIKRGGVSYTVDSLIQIKKIYKDFEIFLLVGSAMFLSLNSWKSIDEIFKIANICVACRNQFDYKKIVSYSKFLENKGAKILVIEFSPFEISSSEIRCKIKNNENIKGLVPNCILEYIMSNNLYS